MHRLANIAVPAVIAPAASNVLLGVAYGPSGNTLTGTATGGSGSGGIVVTVTNPTSSTTSRTITWTAKSGATGYKILRSTDGVTYTEIGQVSSSVLTFVDTARPAGNVIYDVDATQ